MAARTPGGVDLIERLYRALLHVHARDFRERFAAEMIEMFRARRDAAATRGAAARVQFVILAVGDVLRSAVHERSRVQAHGITARPSVWAIVRDDCRTAARRLRRSPSLSATVVVLMALTIGSATAVFSVVNAVLLTPLPFGNPSRIVVMRETRANTDQNGVGGHEYPKWQRLNHSFQRMTAIIYNEGAHLTGAGDPQALFAVRVSAGFLEVMGVAPALGRGFTLDDDRPGQGQVALISDRLWRDRFEGSRAAIGSTLRLNGQPLEVVGVLPRGFGFPFGAENATPDVWTPIAENVEIYAGRHYLFVLGRLNDGLSLAQAQADMTSVAAAVEREMPDFSRGHGVNLVPLHEQIVHAARPSLRLLMGAVVGLVLIGCTNVAGLLFARGLARKREVALELALGATPVRVSRQLLAESVMLSTAGGALGLVGADALTRLLPVLVPAGVLATDAVHINLPVLGFALGLAVVTGLVFGAAPALQLRHVGLTDAIRRGGRTQAGGDRPRLRRGLVTCQIALTVCLVVGAGLMARGLVSLHRINPGFNPAGVLAVDLSLRGPQYRSLVQQRRFFDDVAERLRHLPDVESVGATDTVPLAGGVSGIAITIEGRPAPRPGEEPAGQYHVLTPGYFETMGVRLVSGRFFDASDARVALPLIRWWAEQPQPAGIDAPQPVPVAILNETMARQYWPNESPLGRRFKVLFGPWVTVVGVVADARNRSLRDLPGPEFYLSASQEPQSGMSMMIRATGSPADLGPAVREAVRAIDRNLPITAMRTMNQVMGQTYGVPRFMSLLLGAFAVMAVTLMTAGVYGLLAFTTARRRSEMGVRLALGARRGQIAGLILREGLAMAAAGLALGLLAAVAAGRLIQDQLYGVTPTDRVTFAAVTVLVLGVVMLACWLPARRAARVDPIVVLRQD